MSRDNEADVINVVSLDADGCYFNAPYCEKVKEIHTGKKVK